MKTIKTAAMAALLCTSFITPASATAVGSPSANAADATTQAAEQSQCDALAAVHGPSTGDNDHWTAEVIEGAVTLFAGPTEVDGTRVIDHDSIVGTGTYVPGALYIQGNPYKTGGSVNMFGDQWSSAGYYPSSTYSYTADFASTFAHAFSCQMYDAVYHPLVKGEHHDAVPPEGCYTNPGHSSCVVGDHWCGNEETAHWGHDFGNCVFVQTAPGEDAYDDPDTPAYNDPAAPVGDPEAGVAVNQDQTDSLGGFEPNGPRVDVTAQYFVGKTVICISPGSKGGSWKAQNGYGGGSFTGPAAGCNTPYFKIAPTNSGTTTSQGTFTSVPNYNL